MQNSTCILSWVNPGNFYAIYRANWLSTVSIQNDYVWIKNINILPVYNFVLNDYNLTGILNRFFLAANVYEDGKRHEHNAEVENVRQNQ